MHPKAAECLSLQQGCEFEHSCTGFLASYPHPAFILTSGGSPDQPQVLTYINPSFSSSFNDAVGTEPHNFLSSVRYSSGQSSFAEWILSDEPTIFTELVCPSGIVSASVTKTNFGKLIVCTTVIQSSVSPPVIHQTRAGSALSPDSTLPPDSTAHSTSLRIPFSPTELLETFDWANSKIGPRGAWPQSLKTTVSIVMAAPYPSVVWWGLEAVGIYNDAYVNIAGNKHPQIWGQPVKHVWSEVWDTVKASVRAAQQGTTKYHEEALVFLEKLTSAHLPQECYLSWSHTPIRQESGTVGGFMTHCFDVTEKVIAKRRINCLSDVINSTILTTSLSQFSNAVLAALGKEEYTTDVNFAALYFSTVQSITKGPSSLDSKPTTISLDLSGSIGVPEGHPYMPKSALVQVDYAGVEKGRVASSPSWPFADAIVSRQIIHIEQLDERLISGFEKRGWGDTPREAVVVPIGLADQSTPAALLIIGINTRRPYDATYRNDIDIMRMSLSSTLRATLGREAEVKRSKQLAELDAAKTAFFSNASHELRTPLTLIGGPLEDCISQIADGPVKRQLQMAQRNVSRLKRLVDSLMDISQLEAKRLEGEFRPMRLGLFTADLASLFRLPVEKSGLMYNVECDSRIDQPCCYVDPDLWEKIVFNLIGNAFKYTMDGYISVHLSHTDAGAMLIVQDSGIGILEDDIPKIFERFHRAQSTSRGYEGTGIGLALTKELVGLHGGKIHVESGGVPQIRRGSKFVVTIPYGKDHLLSANVYEEAPDSDYRGTYTRGLLEETILWADRSPTYSSNESPLELEIATASSGGMRLDPTTMFFDKSDVVLLVDDNLDMRRYIGSLLCHYCTVIEASNGRDALDIAVSCRPNVILSDVMMPVMDGFTLLSQLRGRKETSLIPIILLTAKSGADSHVKGLLSGADDYLAKPFKAVELIARVHLQMQLGKKRIEMEEKFAERVLEINQLTELSPVAIFKADYLGRIIYANPTWYRLAGYGSSDGHESHCWLQSVHEDDIDKVSKWWSLARIPVTAGSQHNWIDFRLKNGNWCKGQWSLLDGQGVLGAFTDISGQKEVEQIRLAHAAEKEFVAQRRAMEAEERRKQAEERRRAQELLIDVTSHEIRQPVSAILNSSCIVRTNLSILYDELLSCEGTFYPSTDLLQSMHEDLEALDAIYQCGLAQERIANDVLSLSQIQLDGLSVNCIDFELTDEIHRIVSLFKNELQMKQIDFRTSVGESLKQLGAQNVSCDKDRLAQIITNLLSNAIKFTETSTTTREITIEVNIGMNPPSEGVCIPPSDDVLTRPAPGTPLFVFVAVTDSGPGVHPEDLALLFQRFHQGSNSHNVFGGSGLGLFVSKKLCNLMGGRIGVSSVLGQGATFHFFIEAKAAPGSYHLNPQHEPPYPTLPMALHSAHVLIAEDNVINQTILSRQLKKAGCTTTIVGNGQHAIETLIHSNQHFHAVLMDIEMPVLDGISAVRQIRKMESTGEILRRHRILALTANAREGQVQNIRRAGMDDIIIKPYKIEGLVAKLFPA